MGFCSYQKSSKHKSIAYRLWIGICFAALSFSVSAQMRWTLEKDGVQLDAVALAHLTFSNLGPQGAALETKQYTLFFSELTDERLRDIPAPEPSWDQWLQYARRVFPKHHGVSEHQWARFRETALRNGLSAAKAKGLENLPLIQLRLNGFDATLARKIEKGFLKWRDEKPRKLAPQEPLDRMLLNSFYFTPQRLRWLEHPHTGVWLHAIDCTGGLNDRQYMDSIIDLMDEPFDIGGWLGSVASLEAGDFGLYARSETQHRQPQHNAIEFECHVIPRNALWAERITQGVKDLPKGSRVLTAFGALHALPLDPGQRYRYRSCPGLLGVRSQSYKDYGRAYEQAVCDDDKRKDVIGFLQRMGWKVTKAPKGWEQHMAAYAAPKAPMQLAQ
jgi:hypothetical protein